MAKFYGNVGYGSTVETAPGVYEDVITERPYQGDVIRSARKLEDGEGANKNLTLSNTISIVADAFAFENFATLRYVVWMGVRWTVSDIEVQRPRLILRLGMVYNGPTP